MSKSKFGFPYAERLTNAILRERIKILERGIASGRWTKSRIALAKKRIGLYKYGLRIGCHSVKRSTSKKRAA